MALNLAGCNAGFVILVGDDPGAWGSQNEQDSRVFSLATELPLLEPGSVAGAWMAMGEAFALSESIGLPVLVRITRALALAQAEIDTHALDSTQRALAATWGQQRDSRDRPWVVLPINVVPNHRRLHQRMAGLEAQFTASTLNTAHGDGSLGVVTAGFTYQKLLAALGGSCPRQLSILQVTVFNPFPTQQASEWLSQRDSVLVLEETAPWVERQLRAIAQAARLTLPIYGRDTGQIDREGELFAPQIAATLNELCPELNLSIAGTRSRPMPSRQPLCEDCPYIPVFDALVELMQQLGGRDQFLVVGDPGCMVRAQAPPYRLLDVKNSLGSSIAQAAGLAVGRSASADSDGQAKRIIALCGDSSFLHSGFAGLVDLCRLPSARSQVLVVLLDNGTTALSGGQPHPASQTDARGEPHLPVDLGVLARAAGAEFVEVVRALHSADILGTLQAGLQFEGPAVVIARGPCTRWPTSNQARDTV
jgi:indolepyruvate ferredoxin oxidoreductase alpha subunit